MKRNSDMNMKVRDELKSINSTISMIYGAQTQSEEQRDFFMDRFYIFTLTFKTRKIFEDIYSNLLNDDLKDYYVNTHTTKIALIVTVIVSDLYIKLSHDFVTGRLTRDNNKLYEMIVTAIKKKDTTLLLSNAKYIRQFIESSCNFANAAAYEKIALLSSLDDNDIETLESFNPFFKEEYDHYNVTLDEEFFIRQISKWENGKKDLNVALEKTAEFIIDMSYTDPDKVDDFVDILASYTDSSSKLDEALATGDIEFIKAILNKFYEERKDKTLKR